MRRAGGQQDRSRGPRWRRLTALVLVPALIAAIAIVEEVTPAGALQLVGSIAG